MPDGRPDGTWLRSQREARDWDVPQMARELATAAGPNRSGLPDHDGLVHYVRRWERGAIALSERYWLLYKRAFRLAEEPERIGFGAPEHGMESAATLGGGLSRHDFLVLAATSASLLDMLGSRPAGLALGRARIDGETATGLANVLLGYRQVYRSVGAASLLGPVCGTLNLLGEMAPAAGSYSDAIVSLIGQAASLAGVILMLDQREFAPARPYLAVAARAAQQCGDDELTAIVFACRAFHSAYSGDPADGLAFARHALEVAGKSGIHPRTHGWVAAVTSEMHATLGETADCMRALDIATDLLAAPMPHDPWKGIGAFSEAKLTAYRGGDLMRLGKHRQAQAHLRIALEQLDPVLAKHRCTAHIDLAEAYAHDPAPEPDESARHGISALD
jgi:hypothetical protein